ncbi:MAG: hypothetical protein ACLFPQ_04950 [Candidatus Woesearchaeota archaeon]
MQSLTEFMKKELLFYIKQEFDKGHSLDKIRKALLEGGHHHDLVTEAITSLEKNKFNIVKSLNDPIDKNLDQELYFDIMNSLVRYIEYQLKQDYTQTKIRKILEDYGHSEEIIEKAFHEIEKKRLTEQKPKASKTQPKIFEMAFIILFALLLVFVSGSADEPFDIILIAFAPAIFSILGIYMISKVPIDLYYNWLVPIIITGIFWGIMSFSPIIPGMEVLKISTLNLIIAMVFAYIKTTEGFDSKRALDILGQEVATQEDKEVKD